LKESAVFRRAGVIGLVVCAVVAFGGVAWAHVTVAPDSVVKGGSDVEISFRVPNEETTATTKVQVFIPSSPPFLGVLAQSVPGWTTAVVTTKLAKPIQTDDGPVTEVVTQVTWTAADAAAGIKPGEFGKFDIIVGQVPDSATAVTLKALQTYANGDVVRWIEGPTGEHPAPVLTLTAAETTGSSPTTSPATTPNPTASTKGLAKKSQVDSARTIGIIGIIAGVLGLLVAAGAFLSKRRPAQN
jgi:uncharacterized protein YcnI